MAVAAQADLVLKSTRNLVSAGVGEAGVLVVTSDGVKIGIEVQAASVDCECNEIIDGYSDWSLFIFFCGKLYLVELRTKPKLVELDIFPCNRKYVRTDKYIAFNDFFRVIIFGRDGVIGNHRFDDVTAIENVRLDDARGKIFLTLTKNWGEKVDMVLDLR